MKKLPFILVLLLSSCIEEKQFFTEDFRYENYQSSIDTTFNYLEDIHILISCGADSLPPK